MWTTPVPSGVGTIAAKKVPTGSSFPANTIMDDIISPQKWYVQCLIFTWCPCIALYIEEFSAGQNYIVTILAARDNDSVRVAMCSTLEQSTRMSPSSCNQERAVRPRRDFLKINFSKIKKTIFNFSKISKKKFKNSTTQFVLF
jgi:hypothetical protein